MATTDTDTAQPATGTRNVEQRIAALESERAQLDAAEDGDLLRAAPDVAEWHARDQRRRQRRVEIENSIRSLQTWGLLPDQHAQAIGRYATAARRHAVAVRVRTDDDVPTGKLPEGGATELRAWWDALQRLARQLPHESSEGSPARDEARRVIAREVDRFIAARDAWLSARSMLLGKVVLNRPGVSLRRL